MKVRIKTTFTFDSDDLRAVAFFKAMLARFTVNLLRINPGAARAMLGLQLPNKADKADKQQTQLTVVKHEQTQTVREMRMELCPPTK